MQLKWKLFSHFIIFVAIILVCLWIFQIVFLDSFYKHIKVQEIKSAAAAIERNIDNEDLDELVVRLAQEHNICICLCDSDGERLISVDMLPDCIIHKLPDFAAADVYHKVLDAGESSTEIIPMSAFINHAYKSGKYEGGVPPDDKGMPESLLYADVISCADGSDVLLMMNSRISPVTATVNTLRTQLGIITLIMIVVAFILAIFISRHISKPIVKMNEAAKELAYGNYEMEFGENSGSYREIAELSHTLDHAAKELSKVESLRRELIANISHDLRTPLTLISGYGEVIRDIPGENTPENIQIIIDESRHLSALVSDMLDLSRMQSGEQVIETERVCITDMISDLLNRYGKLISQDGYKIDFTYEEKTYIEADELKLTQVVYNLINNAVTYTGEDKSVHITQRVSDGVVRIEVTDTGEGIAEEDLPYIWERYYKVDKTHKRARIGTGLGLAIVKAVLEQHSARYGVETSEKAGSCFWFEFKCV